MDDVTGPLEPTKAHLADDLARLRYYGVGTPLGSLIEADISHLALLARRVATDETPPLVKLIEDAVRSAIERLHPPQYEQAAAALLWVNLDGSQEDLGKRRRRKPVSTRRAEAAALLGYTAGTFEKHHERRMLEAISEQLLTFPIAVATIDTNLLVNTTQLLDLDNFGRIYLEGLAKDAISLHYTCLTALLLVHLNHEVNESPRPHDHEAWDYCAFRVFDKYLPFIDKWDSWINYIKDHEQSFFVYMQHEQLNSLTMLLRTLETCGPHFTDDQHIVINLYLLDGISARDEIRTLFENVWIEWYGNNLDQKMQFALRPPQAYSKDPPDGTPSGVERLAAQSKAIVDLIQRHIRYDSPLESSARRMALKQVASYYEFDEWLPILDGRSLRDRAEHFFDSTISRLDGSGLV